MSVVYLEKPILIVQGLGWVFPFRFWLGLPPDSTPDPLTGCKSVLTLGPIGSALAPLEIDSDAGTMNVTPGVAQTLVGRALSATWPLGNYELQLRVFNPLDVADRYVVQSHPNRSPVKIVPQAPQ